MAAVTWKGVKGQRGNSELGRNETKGGRRHQVERKTTIRRNTRLTDSGPEVDGTENLDREIRVHLAYELRPVAD